MAAFTSHGPGALESGSAGRRSRCLPLQPMPHDVLASAGSQGSQRIGEGDIGSDTGGMGPPNAPAPCLDADGLERVRSSCARAT